MAYWESDPIVFALNEREELVHVNAVPNGAACGCVCPSCKQPLIARNGGNKLVHHFAHKKGACKWAAETTVIMLVHDYLQKTKEMVIPAASYYSYEDREMHDCGPQGLSQIDSLDFEEISGRGAPALNISCTDENGEKHSFTLMAILAQPISQTQLDECRMAKGNLLAINIRDAYSGMRDRYGRHFSRGKFFLQAQDPDNIQSILSESDETKLGELQWLVQSIAEELDLENERAWRKQHNKEREERRRQRELERQREQQEQERRIQEAERRHEEEKRRRQEELQTFIKHEIESFEARGVETLPLVKQGVHFFVDGCPLYGRANVVTDCGDFVFNTNKCIFFEGKGYYVIGCTAHQNGVGIED